LRTFITSPFAAALCVLTCSLAAIAQSPIHITFEDTVANPGDSIEVDVDLTTTGANPSAMVLFFNYDPDRLEPFAEFYERVLTDLSGQPILDEQGNTITTTSSVRPGPAAENADKGVDSEVHSDGLMSIAVVGLNEALMEDGLLLTIAFRVLPEAQDGETLVIDGRESSEPNGSSASTITTGGQVQPLAVTFQNAFVDIGCVAPAAPTSVNATQNRSDGVLVSWNEPAEELEYRVYRGTSTNPEDATPLGEGWQTDLDFLDITASVPTSAAPAFPGCPPPPAQLVRYNYWVKSRNLDGCESPFNIVPARGHRSPANTKVSLADATLLTLAATTLLLTRRRK
jgi:hypothetical protein